MSLRRRQTKRRKMKTIKAQADREWVSLSFTTPGFLLNNGVINMTHQFVKFLVANKLIKQVGIAEAIGKSKQYVNSTLREFSENELARIDEYFKENAK